MKLAEKELKVTWRLKSKGESNQRTENPTDSSVF